MIEIDVHNKDTIKTALRVIGKGGVIIYPTDTLYGFGVDAANDNAIEKLNNIKGRSGPLSVLAPDETLSLIHTSEPTRRYAHSNPVFCWKKKITIYCW